MGSRTKIQWTDDGSTWTPIRARHRKTGKVGWHCTKPSAGCHECYSEALNIRLGTGERFLPTAPVEVFLDEKMLEAPLRWKTSRKVFVCSMTDLFGEFVETAWIDRMFAVMALCQHPKLGHTFQVLTKRAERMRDYANDPETPVRVAKEMMGLMARRNGSTLTAEMVPNVPAYLVPKWPLANVWKGISAENQDQADKRIPLLLDVRAAVRFLSLEPLLESTDIDIWLNMVRPEGGGDLWRPSLPEYRNVERAIHWIIIGGESGRNARPFNLDWARSLIRQCRSYQVTPFLKQVGSNAWQGSLPDEKPEYRFLTKDSKGGAIEEWPEDIRVREFPA